MTRTITATLSLLCSLGGFGSGAMAIAHTGSLLGGGYAAVALACFVGAIGYGCIARSAR